MFINDFEISEMSYRHFEWYVERRGTQRKESLQGKWPVGGWAGSWKRKQAKLEEFGKCARRVGSSNKRW